MSGFNESDECALSDELEDAAETQAIGITAAVTAADMGRIGGASRTLAKRLAAKTNGKLGGRPRKQAGVPISVGAVSYEEIKINHKVWDTFSPTQMCEYQEKVFAYYRRVGFPFKFTDKEIRFCAGICKAAWF